MLPKRNSNLSALFSLLYDTFSTLSSQTKPLFFLWLIGSSVADKSSFRLEGALEGTTLSYSQGDATFVLDPDGPDTSLICLKTNNEFAGVRFHDFTHGEDRLTSNLLIFSQIFNCNVKEGDTKVHIEPMFECFSRGIDVRAHLKQENSDVILAKAVSSEECDRVEPIATEECEHIKPTTMNPSP